MKNTDLKKCVYVLTRLTGIDDIGVMGCVLFKAPSNSLKKNLLPFLIDFILFIISNRKYINKI